MRSLKHLVVAAAAALAANSAFALPTFQIPGGAILDPFGGIDWKSNGTAYTTNFNQAAAIAGTSFSFTTTYFAYAIEGSGILRPNGTSFNTPGLTSGDFGGGGANPFELTVLATFVEEATCSNGGLSCSFTITGGSFAVYLDTTPDAVTGASADIATQYTNGTQIIAGSIDSGTGNFDSTILGTGSGKNTFFGTVTTTNNTFINPNLVGTTASATIQLGGAITGWDRPTGIVGASDTCTPTSTGCTFAFQADGNQSFSIPEPGSLALLGAVALVAGAGMRRRMKS